MRRSYQLVSLFPIYNSQEIVLPIEIAQNGDHYVNVLAPSLEGANFTQYPFALMPDSQRIFANEGNELYVAQTSENHLVVNRSREHNFVLIDPAIVNIPMSNYLGIGPRSSLMEFSGQRIDIRKNPARLIINPVAQELCEASESVRSRLFYSSESGESAINLDVLLSNRIGDMWRTNLNLKTTSSFHIMSIPSTLYDLLEMQALQGGYRLREGPFIMVNNCEYIRTQLPEIVIRLDSGSLINQFSYLKLYPEDYTRLHSDGRCELLVTRPFPGISVPFLNPFMIPDVDVRLTNDQIIFCDSTEVA